MKIENWITIVSACIIAIGWFVTGYLSKIKDIAQKRLEYRLKALEAFLPVLFAIQKNGAPFTQPGFIAQLEDARSKFQLYGFKDEIDLMEQFIVAIKKGMLPEASEALGKLAPLVRSHIRKELRLNA